MRYFPEEQGYRTRCGSSASGMYLAVGDISVEDLEAAVHLRLAHTDEGRPYLSVELTGARCLREYHSFFCRIADGRAN